MRTKILTFFSLLIHLQTPLAGESIPVEIKHNSLNKSYKDLIRFGNKLFQEGAYEEACAVFQEALKRKNPPKRSLLYQLALAYMELEDYDAVVELLERENIPKNTESQYLLAISYSHLGQYEKAQSLLETYLKEGDSRFASHAKLALAKTLIQMGQSEKSKDVLLEMKKRGLSGNLAHESSLLLSQLFLEDGEVEYAMRILMSSPETSGQKTELLGKAYLMLGKYQEAINTLEKGIASIGTEPGEIKDALLKLMREGYLLGAEDPSLTFDERYSLFQKARSIPTTTPLDTIHYLIVFSHLSGDPLLAKAAKRILSENGDHTPYSLYLMARLANTPDEIGSIASFIDASSKDDRLYIPLAWYHLGISEAPISPTLAYHFFEKAQNSPYLARAAKQHGIELLIEMGTVRDLHTAITQADNHPHLQYLKGVALFKLFQKQKDPSLLLEAQKTWEASPPSSHTQFSLGVVAYENKNWEEAKAIFNEVVLADPISAKAPEALYFISECCENLGENSTQVKEKLIEQYPNSPFAAEAHFSLLPLSTYLSGNEEGSKHLEVLIDRFPNSPLLVKAYFLLGLSERQDKKTSSGKLTRQRNIPLAIQHFQSALKAFRTTKAGKELLPIKFQTLIQKSEAEIEIAELSEGMKARLYYQYANDTLKKLVNEIKTHESFKEQLIEAEFRLAQTYRIIDELDQAVALLRSMLYRYQESKVTRGHYLSRIYYELAMLTRLQKGAPEISLALLDKAEESARGNLLTPDQKLDLWIQKSDCHLHLGEDEEAMKILSRVINEDVASSERLKAMFLRSEIYALQGREELAIKQLEALAGGQGIWAKKAKEKLRTYE